MAGVHNFTISRIIIGFGDSRTQPNNTQIYETGIYEAELSFLQIEVRQVFPGRGYQLARAAGSSLCVTRGVRLARFCELPGDGVFSIIPPAKEEEAIPGY